MSGNPEGPVFLVEGQDRPIFGGFNGIELANGINWMFI
jgi:hypothetical protein